MLSKDETFKPPEIYEEWVNNEFTNVLDYLSEKQINFNGTILLQWLAVPYISIWVASSTKYPGVKIWIIHNMEFTDIILSSDIMSPQQAIIEFSAKWESGDKSSLRVRNNNISKLPNHAKILSNVGNDVELWQEGRI